jgi:hypothetical protein
MRSPSLLVLAALTLACGGGSATAKLELRNDTAAHRPALRSALETAGEAVTPSVLGMKLLAVYLAENVDPATQDNVGRTSMIWVNPQCAGDIGSCNVSGAPGSDAHRVTDFFDFALGTDAVNAALNSQGRPVDAGIYRFVRMEFCKLAPGAALGEPNVEWQAGALSARRRLSYPGCGVTSEAFAAPLELKDGDSVSVTVAYDLARTIASGTPSDGAHGMCFGTPPDRVCYMDCADGPAAGTRTCVNPPVFTPSAAKQ